MIERRKRKPGDLVRTNRAKEEVTNATALCTKEKKGGRESAYSGP